MARLNKKKLRIQLLDEIKLECAKKHSETELNIESELDNLVDVIDLVNNKVEGGSVDKNNAIELLNDEIDKTTIQILDNEDCATLNSKKLKVAILGLLQHNFEGGSVDLDKLQDGCVDL